MTAPDANSKIKEQTHEASLFFPTPDGSALLFNLVGRANPPNPHATIDITDIKAKKTHRQDLKIANWLKQTQRFKVTWEVAGDDQSILIKGANTIDIMGEASKDYKLFIYCLRPGQGKVTVTFTNEATGEYLFYKLVSWLEMYIRKGGGMLIIIEKHFFKKIFLGFFLPNFYNILLQISLSKY